jgi:hypothetical protein
MLDISSSSLFLNVEQSLLFALDDHFVELSTLYVLHDQVDLTIVLENLEGLSDIGMPQLLDNSQLPREVELVPRIDDHLFAEYLHCYFLVSFNMVCLFDSGEGSSAYSLAQVVPADYLRLLSPLNLLLLHLYNKPVIIPRSEILLQCYKWRFLNCCRGGPLIFDKYSPESENYIKYCE